VHVKEKKGIESIIEKYFESILHGNTDRFLGGSNVRRGLQKYGPLVPNDEASEGDVEILPERYQWLMLWQLRCKTKIIARY